MLNIILLILNSLEKKNQKKLFFVSISQFFLLFFELLFIVSIIPLFTILLSQKQEINTFSFFFFFFFSKINLVNFATIFLILFAFLKFVYSSLHSYYQNLYLTNITAELSNKLYSKYLNSKYFFHLYNDSSKLYEQVFTETGQFRDFTSAFLSIISEFIFLLSMLLILIFFDPLITISSVVFLLIILGFFYLITKGKSY